MDYITTRNSFSYGYYLFGSHQHTSTCLPSDCHSVTWYEVFKSKFIINCSGTKPNPRVTVTSKLNRIIRQEKLILWNAKDSMNSQENTFCHFFLATVSLQRFRLWKRYCWLFIMPLDFNLFLGIFTF